MKKPFSLTSPGFFFWLKLVLLLISLVVVFWAIAEFDRIANGPPPQAPPSIEFEINVPTPRPAASPEATPEPASEPAASPKSENDPTPGSEGIRSVVTYVYDGDSVLLADGRQVRFISIDAPELDTPFFQEATEFNKRLVQMKSVRLEVCPKRPFDQYGRTLAHVYVDNTSVEDAILSAGLAEVFSDRDCVADCRPGWKIMLDAFQHQKGMFAAAETTPLPAVVADRLIGHYGLITGIVDNIRESTSSIHLNFGKELTTAFSATLLRRDLESFLRDKLNPRELTGFELTLFGKVVSSNGPRMFLVCPAQVVALRAV